MLTASFMLKRGTAIFLLRGVGFIEFYSGDFVAWSCSMFVCVGETDVIGGSTGS